VISTSVAQDPALSAVAEETEEQKDEENEYERIIDDTEPEQHQQDYDEDALLEEEESDQQQQQQPPDAPKPEQQAQLQPPTADEQMETEQTEGGGDGGGGGTEDENRGVKRRSDSPSKGNSPKKRQRLPPPNIDDFVNDEDEPELDESKIQLSWFDSDLNLKIDRETFCSAVSLSDTGLALVWAGARANYGAINNGKYFYEMQLLAQNTKISYPNERNLHEIRCGWSTASSSLQLGENDLSFGLDSSGRKCCNAEFSDYGVKLGVLDVVGVLLDLNDEKCTVQFTINGKDQGVAFEFEKSTLNEQALFPHIVTKNIEFKVNFGQLDASLWSQRREGHKESELQRRRKDLERKKKDLERKREEKLKKQQEAEAAKVAAAAAAAAPEISEANAGTSEEKPADEQPAAAADEKPTAEEVQPEAPVVEEKKEQPAAEEEPEPALPEDISEDEIEQDTPYENCLPGYTYISSHSVSDLSQGPRRPEARVDCEVIMTIGLPGAGKSHWALQRAKEFPEKRYTLLGTKYLLEKMRINGQPRKPNSGPGRWEKLIELCNRGLLTLNEIACKRRRNFILDQPHVYISDQRRKMRVYGDFKRIAAIVVPNEEEYKKRSKQRLETEGKDIPDSAVNEMRANITLPELEYQWFSEILYTDLEKEPATEEVGKENERGKKALNQRNRQNNYRGGRDFNNRNDRRWGGGNNNRNDFRRNDRWGPPNQQQRNMGGGGGGYRRDFDFNNGGGGGGGGGGNRGRNNWNGPDNWNRPRGGYGGERTYFKHAHLYLKINTGAPPPRPGQKGRQQDNSNRNRNDRRDFRQGGGGGGGGNSNNRNNNRRQDGNKKFGGKNDWNSQGGGGGGPWSGNNWGNNFGGGNQGKSESV
jgi:heterogeneous nuclear ribonucleoprotein U-like protein 1